MNKLIDHTSLKAETSKEDIVRLCNEAIEYEFASVCVNPCYVQLASDLLANTNVKVCTVIGFPLGANTTDVKLYEISNAIDNGADELDVVVNVGKVLDNDMLYVYNELKEIRQYTEGKVLKVIFETCLLSKDLIIRLCEICKELRVDFVKTSTGFSTYGATIEDVSLMSGIVEPDCQVKASGGIKSYEDAKLMIKSGAKRIGTSNGVLICK